MGYAKPMQSHHELLELASDLSDTCLTLPPIPSYYADVNFLEEEVHEVTEYQNGCTLPMSVGDYYLAPISQVRLMTTGEDVKKVLSLCLELKDFEDIYVPGDSIGILPCNSDNDVEKFAEFLNLKNVLHKKCVINVRENSAKKKCPFPAYVPRRSSLHHILKTCVDLRSIPKKVFLAALSEYTSDECQKRCLQELCSKEGSQLYNNRILDQGPSILDILRVFSSCRPPIGRILEFLPRLMPRPYSIASSPLVTQNQIRIVLTVVEEPQDGICSGWLYKVVEPSIRVSECSLEQRISDISVEENKYNLKVPMFFRKSNGFHLPDDPSQPIILIGPGTGIAPFIGFIEHRAAQKKCCPNKSFGDIMLFYGCRYADRDFLFRDELELYQKEGVISDMFVSFSREGSCEAKYVQNNIRIHSQRFINQFLEKKSILYVCGDGRKMAKDVWDTIIKVISSEKGMSETDAALLLTKIQKEGYYRQDIWV